MIKITFLKKKIGKKSIKSVKQAKSTKYRYIKKS